MRRVSSSAKVNLSRVAYMAMPRLIMKMVHITLGSGKNHAVMDTASHGVHIGVNGSYFEGEWARDLRNGPGYLKLEDGTEYEGTWKANRMEGRGVIKYPDGGRYEGNIRLGKKDGRGKYIFPSGAEYEGRFRDDKIDGMGTLRMEGGISFVKTKTNTALSETHGVKVCDENLNVAVVSKSSKDGMRQFSKDDVEDEEIMIPIDLQKDLATIHFVAGFDRYGK
eukprot:g450.t1